MGWYFSLKLCLLENIVNTRNHRSSSHLDRSISTAVRSSMPVKTLWNRCESTWEKFVAEIDRQLSACHHLSVCLLALSIVVVFVQSWASIRNILSVFERRNRVRLPSQTSFTSRFAYADVERESVRLDSISRLSFQSTIELPSEDTRSSSTGRTLESKTTAMRIAFRRRNRLLSSSHRRTGTNRTRIVTRRKRWLAINLNGSIEKTTSIDGRVHRAYRSRSLPIGDRSVLPTNRPRRLRRCSSAMNACISSANLLRRKWPPVDDYPRLNSIV